MNPKKPKLRRQKHVPQRTCVICREKVDKRRLTRIVRTPDSGVMIDPTGKENGRGAYLCDNPDCWEKAVQQKQLLQKALMVTLQPEEWDAITAQKPMGTRQEE